jgi:hypothetical protein
MIPVTPIQRALLEEYHQPRTDGGLDLTPEDYIGQLVCMTDKGLGLSMLVKVYDDWPVAFIETLLASITPEQREAVRRRNKEKQK